MLVSAGRPAAADRPVSCRPLAVSCLPVAVCRWLLITPLCVAPLLPKPGSGLVLVGPSLRLHGDLLTAGRRLPLAAVSHLLLATTSDCAAFKRLYPRAAGSRMPLLLPTVSGIAGLSTCCRAIALGELLAPSRWLSILRG